MNDNNISEAKLQEMLKAVGVSPDRIKDVDKNKLNKILSDPEKVKEIMSSPAAQALLKKFANK